MGLTSPSRTGLRRLWYVWSWRVRYWWLDTPRGHAARVWLCVLVAFGGAVQLARVSLAAVDAHAPQQAMPWWVVQLIILAISALVSWALAPKPEKPKPNVMDAPTTEDGLAAKHHFGTVWIGDEFLLAWKMLDPEPIKAKGGK